MSSQLFFESPRPSCQSPQVGTNNCWSMATSHKNNHDPSQRTHHLKATAAVLSMLLYVKYFYPGAKGYVFSEHSEFLIIKQRTPGLIFHNYLPVQCSGSRLQAPGTLSHTCCSCGFPH